jgi:glycosyltransferase involved in cell wall biosynthesis
MDATTKLAQSVVPMSLSILNVAFPFAPLSADPVGGAEQVLGHLDRMLVAAGHRSRVIAAAGSQVAGELIPIGLSDQRTWNEAIWKQTHEAVRLAIARVCAEVDLVHLHGSDFHAYLPPEPVPTLVTLHMALDSYPAAALNARRHNTWFNPVSEAQARTAWPGLELLPPIENGVAIDTSHPHISKAGKKSFSLVLGRVCPEKGFHCAIEASARAGLPLYIAGTIYPWPEHVRYFEEQIVPRLDAERRWIGQIGGERKRTLMSAARCVLIPSLVEETSSLVAMEALAAGTPVIAFRVGALPDIVEHGATGYIVAGVEEMAEALTRVDQLDAEVCRDVARRRFDLRRSVHAYLGLYQLLAGKPQMPLPRAADAA